MTVRGTGLYRRLLSGGFWALVGRAGSAVLGLLLSMLLARVVPPQELGLYFQAVAVVGMATGVFQLGLPQSALREIAASRGRDDARSAALARASVWLGLAAGGVGALVLGLVLGLAGSWLPPGWQGVAVALSGWLFGMVVAGIVAESFRGAARLRAAAVFGGMLGSALVLALVALAWFREVRLDFAGVARLFMAGMLLNAVLALVHAATCFGLRRPARAELQALMRAAASIGVTNILLLLFSQADVLVLGLFRDSAEVALYGAAARLVALVAIMLGVVNLAVSPLIAELAAQDRRAELERMLRRTATLAGLPALLLLAAFAAEGGRILALVFGANYSAAAGVLVILALGQVVNVLAGSCGTVLVMTGHSGLLLRLTLACGGSTLAASALLASVWGGPGVAAAIAMGLALQNVLMVVAAWRKAGVRTYCYVPGLSRDV